MNNTINIQIADRIAEVKTYYFATKLQEIAQMNAAGKDVINLGIGNPDLPPPKSVLKKLEEIIPKTNNGYQSYTGIPALKNAIANWYKQIYNIELNADKNVLPLIGSKEAIFHIAQAFLNPGDKVLIPNPGYPAYAATAKLAGAEIVYYPLLEEKNWQPDFQFIENQELSKVKIIWCNYPNMPTGAEAKQETFEKLVKIGNENDIIICHDNPYSFIQNEKPKSILEIKNAEKCCIELNSLSKSHHLAGWRIGMLLANNTFIKQVLKVKTNIDSGMYKGLQLAAVEALKTKMDWHLQQNEIYKNRKNKIVELFNTLKCKPFLEGKGMFVWAKIPDNKKTAEAFADEILEKTNVFVTPGFIFGNNGANHLRASLCINEERIEEAIERIKLKLI